MTSYVAVYRSGADCVARFASQPRSSLDFPAQVGLRCQSCKKTHSFNLDQSVVVSTPRQVERFKARCDANGVEWGIEIGD